MKKGLNSIMTKSFNEFKKITISIIFNNNFKNLILFFMLTISCSAANVEPYNGVISPLVPVTKPIVEQSNLSSSDGFSVQPIKSQVSDINPKEGKHKLQEIYSGYCGDSVTWAMDTETGVITISGSGQMASIPWDIYKQSITSVIIEDGVSNIISSGFGGCYRLTSVTIPNSVTSIDFAAFFFLYIIAIGKFKSICDFYWGMGICKLYVLDVYHCK